MEKRKPPIRVVVPGRCYRYEATDAIRESIFFQYEGLRDRTRSSRWRISRARSTRSRGKSSGAIERSASASDYFPFTEPSAEIAFDCFACEGKDPQCRVCGGDGWIEAPAADGPPRRAPARRL